MSGQSIKQARNALMLFLKSLPGSNVFFNIVGTFVAPHSLSLSPLSFGTDLQFITAQKGFGSSHESLFPSSVAYNDNSLRTAQQHVLSLSADLGGTEILQCAPHL
jgi:hypothetical protein